MNWLYYLAEANLYLCVFYLAYCIFLSKETHYQLNRAYLLFSCVAAFTLPLLQIGALKPAVNNIVTESAYLTPAQLLPATVEPVLPEQAQLTPQNFSFDEVIWLLYFTGLAVTTLMLALKLYSVLKLTRKKAKIQGRYKIIYLEDTNTAFSFFNYLFIGEEAAGTNTIITHELIHIRQKHSVDIMLLELLKITSWFNPVIYMLQNSLKTVHEYVADEQTAAGEEDVLTYSSFLVNNAYGAGGYSITHSFINYNLLKKRIIMLNQQRSGNLARLKYLIVLPACAGMLCASTLAFSKSYGWIEIGGPHMAEKQILNNTPDTLKTKKGYKYTETINTKNGFKTATVTFYEPGGKKTIFNSSPVSASKINLLKDKYGYQFPEGTIPPPPPPAPAKPKVDQVRFPPPVVTGNNGEKSKIPTQPKPKVDQVRFPPPVVTGNNGEKSKIPTQPKPKVDQVRFPPPVVTGNNGEKSKIPTQPKPKVDQVRFPPPVVTGNNGGKSKKPTQPKPKVDKVKFPPAPTGDLKTSTTGYQYEETGYLAGDKQYYRVIIHEKNGEEKAYFKHMATKAQINMLKDKYGYVFPDIKLYDKLPPPPPEPGVN